MTKHFSLLFWAVLFFGGSLIAGEVAVQKWLYIGPLPIQKVAFADSVPTAEQILIQRYLTKERYWPMERDYISWMRDERANWSIEQDSILAFADPSSGEFIGYAAAYLTTDRWQELTIKARSTRPILLYIEGEEAGKCAKANEQGVYEISADYTAHTGKHTLIFKTVDADTLSGEWTLSARAAVEEGCEGTVAWDVAPARAPAYYGDYAMFEQLTRPAISSDGKYVAVLRSKRDDEYKKHSWIEIVEAAAGRHVETLQMETSLSNPQFLEVDPMLTFTTVKDGKTTMWMYAIESRELTKLLEDVEGFQRAQVTSSRRFVYYEVEEENSDDDATYTLYQRISDKVTDYNEHKRLYVKSLADGSVRPVTEPGSYDLFNWKLSPRRNEQIFMVRSLQKTVRPYSDYEFWVFDAASGNGRLLETRPNIEYPVCLTWISDNEIAYAFGSHDADPADTVFHNASNLNLYVLNFNEGKSRNLTAHENFAVADEDGHQRIYWNPKDKMIWFQAVVGGHRQMMKIAPSGERLQPAIKTRHDYIDYPSLSADGTTITYLASSSTHWEMLYSQNTKGGTEQRILDINQDLYGKVVFGNVQEWDFVNEDGLLIDGWLHTPANFSMDKQWPLIVYFYGGVSPRDIRFYFTYQWWLANGYCVYVLNPVGCAGYGQEFADLHANDWGLLATRDVIEGTTKILEAKPFLDRERVGAYGGSYGGFVTLDLVSRTDLFAAAADMYGISNITSYFGGGTWGHWYSEIASPGSFPWSDRDIYVDRSPLYNADKIHTPLLLLHGDADDNVPPVESDQMFAALQLLGQDVVYAKFHGEGHGIVGKFENYIEHREMMLEWFDKYLKDQPEAWEARLEKEK
ncbi:prolyl oligopeptidase family serine peptidase [bacterium]|nr:prolyl oligopeptidase family serine peptidase [bacterium]